MTHTKSVISFSEVENIKLSVEENEFKIDYFHRNKNFNFQTDAWVCIPKIYCLNTKLFDKKDFFFLN